MVESGGCERFDALESYLASELDLALEPASVETSVLSDGLNLVLEVSTHEDGSYVVRRPNKLRRTALFIDPKREYEVLRRLRDSRVPAPEPVVFCDDRSILGEPFIVTTLLEGEVIPLGSPLPTRFQTPDARERIATVLVDTLADVHSLPPDNYIDVCEHLTPLDQVERGVARLDEVEEVTGRTFTKLRSVAQWLERNAPSDFQRSVVHGDFRPGNVLFSGASEPSITGVLDWETTMIGDPLTELGYLLLRWGEADDPAPSLEAIEARYTNANESTLEHLRDANEHGLAPFTRKAGSPSRRTLVERYEGRTGFSFEHDRFYRTHAAFMLAVVWADLHRHRIDCGEESNWEPHVDYMTLLARNIMSGRVPL
ncbi:phosphotransferase family protein [Natrialbaceae archaeon A-CW3]